MPDELSVGDCKDDKLPATLCELTLAYMSAVAAESARPGGFIPAFGLTYRDGASMVTVGGVLPRREDASRIDEVIRDRKWPGNVDKPITAPLLTLKEASVLQSELPSAGRLTRAVVKRLGFDLEESQIEAFQRHYRYYPAYAQIVL